MTTQRALLDQARQGDPTAITTLMNHLLTPQGARVQVKRRGNDYKILIESAQVPEQAAKVKWIVQGLNKLAIANIQSVTIYGRSQQSDKPDWQQSISFAPQRRGQPNQAPSTAQPPTAQNKAEKSEPSPEKPLAQLPEPSAPQPKQEQKQEQSSASEAQRSLPTELSQPPIDLSEHCFTRNKSLLSGSLTPPSEKVSQVVLAFAALPNEQKCVLLPYCQKLLRKPEPVEDDTLSEASQAVVAAILPLEGNDLRKLSIWLSRYCAHPAATAEALMPKAPEPAPEPVAADPESPTPATTYTAHASSAAGQRPQNSSSAQRFTASARRPSSAPQDSMFEHTGRWPVWLVPAVWTVGLLIAIALGVGSVDETAYAYPICENSSAPTETCALAVQLAGGEDVDMIPVVQEAAPITVSEELRTQALEQCSYAAYLQTADFESMNSDADLDTQFKAVAISASTTQTVFPGVLLTDITQQNPASAATPVRMACVDYVYKYTDAEAFEYGVTAGETGIASFTADIIPMAWPDEPYADLADDTLVTAKSLGMYDVFITFGANTLFTAVGILVAVIFCSCYRCNSLQGVYQTACVLGFVETLMHMIPGFGFFASLAMDVVAIGITSRFVKDFHVDWSDGYGPLARGAITIMAIRTVMYWLLYAAIFSYVSSTV